MAKPVKKTAKPAAKPVAKTTRKAQSFEDMVSAGLSEDEVIEGTAEAPEESTTPTSVLSVYQAAPAMDASDLFIPRIRLAQGLTNEVQSGEAKPGQWLVLGNEPLTTATVVPLKMARRRELREVGGGRVVLCRSSDSITGVGDPGGECATCPMSKWTQGTRGGKNTAPPCTFIYSYLVYVVEADSLALLEFYRTSISAGKMVNTFAAQRGLGRFAVVLGSKSDQGPRGTYYSPVVRFATVKPEVLRDAAVKANAL